MSTRKRKQLQNEEEEEEELVSLPSDDESEEEYVQTHTYSSIVLDGVCLFLPLLRPMSSCLAKTQHPAWYAPCAQRTAGAVPLPQELSRSLDSEVVESNGHKCEPTKNFVHFPSATENHNGQSKPRSQCSIGAVLAGHNLSSGDEDSSRSLTCHKIPIRRGRRCRRRRRPVRGRD
jgi:hypothetical protein